MENEKQPEKEQGNFWLNGMTTCPNCGMDLRKQENYEKATGCDRCHKSFLE